MSDVQVQQQDRVLVCTFDRAPAANASTPAMIGDWLAALEQAAHDPSIGAVVTAATGTTWCAGADLRFLLSHLAGSGGPGRRLDALARELITGPADQPHPALRDFAELGLNAMVTYLRAYPKPLVAAIDGAVAGGGFPLALLHDVRWVSAAASFRTSFVDIGLVTELGLAYLLPRLTGAGLALDLCLSSRVVRGEELVHLGIAERFAPDTSAAEAAIAYAADLATRPPGQVGELLRLLRSAVEDPPLRSYLHREWAIQRDAFDSPEAHERIQSLATRMGLIADPAPAPEP